MKKIILIIKVIVTIFLLLFIFKRFDFSRFLKILSDADLIYFIYALLFVPIILLIRGLKWKLLLNNVNINIDFKTSFKSVVGGLAIGIITPGRVGEVSRSVFIKTNKKIEISGLVLVDRVIDLFAILLFSLYGVYTIISIKSLSIFTTLIVFFIFLFLFSKKIRRFISSIGKDHKSKFIKKINQFLNLYGNVEKKTIICVIFLSLFMYLLTFFQFYFLVKAFSDIELLVALKTSPLIQFMSVIPITLFGLGLREGTAIYLLKPYDISEVAAFNSSFLSFGFNILFAALIGVFFIHGIKGKEK
jgi:uncharacterized protein (TIRG00374 family)